MNELSCTLPEELLEAYRHTAYVVTGAPFPLVLMVGIRNETAARLLQSRGLKSALFITAHNPWGQRLLPEQNQSRHAELLREMAGRWDVMGGFGVSPRGDWPAETGVLVLCDKPREHDGLLAKFQQNAAVQVTAQGEVSLLLHPAPPMVVPEADTLEHWPPVPEFAGFPAHERLCFYPSCGSKLLWAVMQMDADLFVFTDKDRRYANWDQIEADFVRHRQAVELLDYGWDFIRFRSGDKTGLLLWEDNNDTLDRLQGHGCQVHHFVGICDGCCEGGNRECVHERPFVRRLMRVAADGMRYITDHSRPLQGIPWDLGRGMGGHYDFLWEHSLSHFRSAPSWNRSREDDWGEWSGPDGDFQLVALLTDGCRHLECRAPEQRRLTQLRALRPFGRDRSIQTIAEYVVARRDRLTP